MSKQSLLMSLLRKIGLEALAWSLRRLYCPVSEDSLVLEVGSGGNPFPRSNVLLDAYEETRERHWDPLVHDRPTVLARGERLPFKDKAFDFVIAAHVLEHSAEPEKFLSELQRVARAGYIETPDAFFERINPYKDHRLEISQRDDILIIRKKANWIGDKDLVELYEHRAKKCFTQSLFPKFPTNFHVQYYWNEKIQFKILNPEVDAEWLPPVSSVSESKTNYEIKQRLRQYFLISIRWLFSQRKRNQAIDLLPLMLCPICQKSSFRKELEKVICCECSASFSNSNGVFTMWERKKATA